MGVPGSANLLLLGGERGYQIERSLRFNSADSAYLNRTPASAGNRKTFTWSGWVKRSGLGATQILFIGRTDTDNKTRIDLSSTETLRVYDITGGGTERIRVYSTQLFRDFSAWYHIVVAVDTTQATASNRVKVYVNGSQITAFGTADYPSQNTDTFINATNVHEIGREVSSLYYSGYLAEINFIDGQALTPSSFGETDTITGVWKPKKYTGTYGTNGFYLKFADNSGTTSTTLGKDSSGNGNNWTPNNFSVTAGAGNDSLIDTPTPYADGGNGRGNYCTWLPQQGGQTWTFSNGNLDAVNGNVGSAAYSCIGTIAVSTGKWYWEVTCNDAGGTTLRVPGVGIMGSERNVLSTAATVRPDVYLSGNGTIDNSAGTALQSGFSNMAAGDIVGVAVDAGAKTVQFYRNGSAVGTAQSYTPDFVAPSFYSFNTYDCNANFGQRPFAYTPPSGFLALNTQNLPEPSIKKPSSYMDTVLWTGNATYPRAITGLNFSPDLVWIKSRSTAYDNLLMDAVRGTGNLKWVSSNLTDAEGTNFNNANVTSLDSAGFTIGTTGGTNILNTSGVTNVAWCWDESATPGFDIVTYTGNGTNPRTVSHSLGVAPKFVIVKSRDSGTDNWNCWHTSLNNTAARILLNTTGAVDTGSPSIWGTGGINPTSTTFQVGDNTGTNKNTDRYVAYLWSEVAGFSKFGSYTGNGSSDGPFVFCGFRPRFVMMKSSSISGSNWRIFDTARDPANVMIYKLSPNNSDSEYTDANTRIDFTSNGFKLRETAGDMNSSGATYVFAAFAETPAKYSLAR